MINFQKARIKLKDTQLNKSKSAAKIYARKCYGQIRKTLKMKNCHMNCF